MKETQGTEREGYGKRNDKGKWKVRKGKKGPLSSCFFFYLLSTTEEVGKEGKGDDRSYR